jgi:sortase (surface protein transpeptidase)
VETIDTPEWIEIPRLGVVDDIVPVELAPDRTMSVPPVDSIGWYALGVLVGEPGPAVLPGHVNWDGVPGAFQRLSSLAPGDSILVRGDGDEQLQFEVYRIDTVAKAEFDTRLVYGDTDGPELRLVTCSGQVVNRSYLDNTVVSARLVAA